MAYEAKDFNGLLGTKGFSDKLLNTHFKLYQGYVANTNKLLEKLKSLEAGTPEFAELKRRFGWEFNGMRLHELYFGNMSKEEKKLGEDTTLFKKMVEEFGTGMGCHDDFVAAGAMRGIGWVVLAYDPQGDRLFNVWINEHDVGHLAGAVPLLVMDVFEHAFIMDYDMNRGEYIKAFINAVDWDEVQKRFEAAK